MAIEYECPNCSACVHSHHNDLPDFDANYEEYPNFYGRICPYCNSFIPPVSRPPFIEENEAKLKLLQEAARECIRKRIKNELSRWRTKMAISTDQTHVTIEFQYESDEIENYRLVVRYKMIDGIPTVSLSDDGESWTDFPASLFIEITDFLRHQGVVSSQGQRKQTSFSMQAATPHAQQSPPTMSSLQMPQIQKKGSAPDLGQPQPQPQPQQETEEPSQVANIDPVETFAGLESMVTKGRSKPKSQPQQTEDVINRPVIRANSEEESKAMRGEANTEKSIKRL